MKPAIYFLLEFNSSLYLYKSNACDMNQAYVMDSHCGGQSHSSSPTCKLTNPTTIHDDNFFAAISYTGFQSETTQRTSPQCCLQI